VKGSSRQTPRSSASNDGVPPNGPSNGSASWATSDQVGQLAGRAVDPARQLGVHAAGAGPVLRRGEDARGCRDGAQVGEQRAHRVLDDQRVPGGARGGAEQHRRPGEGVLVQDVEERLEQPAVGRREHRRDRDQPVGADHRVDRRAQRLVGESGDQVVGEVAGVLAQLDHFHGDVDAPLAQGGDGGRGEPVGQQPGGRRDTEPGADHGQRAGAHRAGTSCT
jgi:hypothetical protein